MQPCYAMDEANGCSFGLNSAEMDFIVVFHLEHHRALYWASERE